MSPIAFQIGNFAITKYSLCILTAFITGYVLALLEAKKHGISKEFVTDCLVYLVPTVILGARLYYVFFEFSYYKKNLAEIFMIWHGGLAIHGGVLAGLIFLLFYTKKHKVDTLKFIDICAVSLVIGQAIGRWGNFFNQEAFGPEIGLTIDEGYKFLKSLHIPEFIIENMKIDGMYHHPTFLYESVGCVLIFITALLLRRVKKLKKGTITAVYLIGYGILRFFIEALRQDSLMFLGLKVAQVVSLTMFLIGVYLLLNSILNGKKYYEQGD